MFVYERRTSLLSWCLSEQGERTGMEQNWAGRKFAGDDNDL
jgi:hypothetical protein